MLGAGDMPLRGGAHATHETPATAQSHAAVRARILDAFVRVDDARSADAGGTRLGLAIAKQGVRAHGAEYALPIARSAAWTSKFDSPSAAQANEYWHAVTLHRPSQP